MNHPSRSARLLAVLWSLPLAFVPMRCARADEADFARQPAVRGDDRNVECGIRSAEWRSEPRAIGV
jgi:hypothetical protein